MFINWQFLHVGQRSVKYQYNDYIFLNLESKRFSVYVFRITRQTIGIELISEILLSLLSFNELDPAPYYGKAGSLDFIFLSFAIIAFVREYSAGTCNSQLFIGSHKRQPMSSNKHLLISSSFLTSWIESKKCNIYEKQMVVVKSRIFCRLVPEFRKLLARLWLFSWR